MKILHFNNVANVATELSRVQRARGHQSDVLHFRRNRYGYEYDHFFDIERFPRPIYFLLRFYHQLKFLNYDVYHLHSGYLYPFYLDALILRPLGKRVFFHFHGSDVRLHGREPFFARWADACWVSNPDLLKYFRIPATLIPLSLDVDRYRPYLRREPNPRPVVFHSASRPEFSGSEHVFRAVARLREQGMDFAFLHPQGAAREEFLSCLSQADIVIDKVVPTTGTYAMLALEALAMKKVVCVNLTEESRRYLPSPVHPLVPVTPENLEETLRCLLLDREGLQRRGEQGFEYVRAYHNAVRIGSRLVELYAMSRYELKQMGPTLSYGA